MSLEELVGAERLEEIQGTPFGIPLGIYNRKKFVKHAEDLFDLREYYQALRQDTHNQDALDDLRKIAARYHFGDPQTKQEVLGQDWQENPHLALDWANSSLSFGETAMARYVEKKRDKFLRDMTSEQLFSVLLSAPLYKTGNKEHDRIATLRDKVLEIEKAGKEGKDLTSVVEGEVKELLKRLPPEQQVYVIRNQHLLIPRLSNLVVRTIQNSFSKIFRDNKGNLDPAAIREYLKDNYQVAYDFMDREDLSDEDKEKYWDENLKPQYLLLAQAFYPSEKKKQKQEDNPEQEKRKAKAIELGIRNP